MAENSSIQSRIATWSLLAVVFVAGCVAPVESPQSSLTSPTELSTSGESAVEVGEVVSQTMVAQVQALSDEIRTLRDQVDVLENELDETRQRQKDLYDDLDARLRKLEPSMATGTGSDDGTSVSDEGTAIDSETAEPSEEVSGEIPVEIPTEADEAVVDPTVVREIYDDAFRTLRQGKYEDSIIKFKALIQNHPESELVDDSLYWIAEANYVTKNFDVALPVFEQIIRDYSENRRAPEAMLKIGYIYYDQQNYEQAQSYLLEVIDRFPASRSAFSARRRLDKMERDGNL